MLQLHTLGELRLDGIADSRMAGESASLVVLAYLARRSPHLVSRVELSVLLGAAGEEDSADHPVDRSLAELQRLVGPALELSANGARLVRGAVAVDVDAFERDIEEGRDRDAVDRWHGDFLSGADAGAGPGLRRWIDAERTQLRRRLSTAYGRILDEAERRGDLDEASTTARRWLSQIPGDAEASRRLTAVQGHGVQRSGDTPAAPSSPPAVRRRPESATRFSRETALPLVGRARALGVLHAAWRLARADTPAVVVVLAARGYGASRLCEQLIRSTQGMEESSLLLHADASEIVAPSPEYGMASVLLQELAAAATIDDLPGEVLAPLAHLLPRLRVRVPTLERLNEPPGADALMAAAREGVEAAARSAPVLLVADSLSEADPASRVLVETLATQVRGAVMQVLVLQPDDPLVTTLRQQLPSLRVVTLEPLGVDDIARLVEQVAPIPGAERRDLAREIHEETGGVPRYVAAELSALRERGGAEGERAARARESALALREGRKLPVPSRVRDDIERSLRTLDDASRRALDGAAVLSGPFAIVDLARVTGLSPEEATQALGSLTRLGFVATIADRHAITPPVLERAVYTLIPPRRREALHAAAATLPAGSRPWHGMTERELEAKSATAPLRTNRRRLWAVAASVLVVALAAAIALLRRDAEIAREREVIVFPFEVRGDGNVAYLSSGMMDLLGTSLDGIGGYHTVDTRAVLAAVRARAAAGALTPVEAQRLADRFGATYFVLGSVIGSGGRLQVGATLHDARRQGAVVARASAFGSEDALFGIVDRVTAQLAVAQGAAAGERLAQLAAVTTSSLEALRAYLEGRAAYRANDLATALPAFERAVAADSSFALAWYGMAMTASWLLRSGLEQRAAGEAVRQAARLSARDRLMVEGFAAYAMGRADSAEAKARAITETYDDLEGWALLGEVLFHHNWKRGRPIAESRRAWERVLELDPHHWPAIQHLSEVAALEGRRGDADSLLARYEREVGTQHMLLASRALRAHLQRDTSARAALRATLADDGGFFIINSAYYVAVFGRDPKGAETLVRLLLDPRRDLAQRGFGHLLLAHLALAQGRWREARTELALAQTAIPADAQEHRLLLSLVPFLRTPDTVLARERLDLLRLTAPPRDLSAALPWPRPHASIHPHLRAYLVGLASARLGEEPARLQAIRELESLSDPTGALALGEGLAHTLRAEAFRLRGRPAEALAALERGALRSPFVAAWTSSVVSQGYERWLRAELLRELGRTDEALRWYGTFSENSPYDLVYLGPALYWQGRILEERGDRVGAQSKYARFVELWRDADPELAGLLEEARGRMH